MAIQFARSERISRGKGGNAVRSAAYAMREKLYDERTGETHKFKDDGTLQHAGILLTDGTDPKFLDAATLFNSIEGAEIRKDAQVAQHVVLALDSGISPEERVEMATGFARQLFVDKGKPVLVCIHDPHNGDNPHAHLIAGTRQLGPEGFAPRKDRDTAFARILGRTAFIVQSERERVGELWRDFQNQWFSAHGKAITVDPVAPVPQQHLGPVRFRAPDDNRIAANEQARELNAKIARDPQAVAEHMRKQATPFDGRALSHFMAKYVADPDERESVEAEVRTRLHNFQREALQKAAWLDRTGIGGPISVEYVARQLSPEYDRLLKKAAELRDDARKAEWARNRQIADKEAGEYRVAERWSEMGFARRLGHFLGSRAPRLAVLRDIELDRWSGFSKRGEWGEVKWSIRGATISGGAPGARSGELQVVERLAAAEFEKIRAAAQRELESRQKIAGNARERLDTFHRDDKVTLRARRSQSRGPSL